MKLEDLNPTDGGCRSFISIIFPKLSTLTIMLQNTLVSILYKYHISLSLCTRLKLVQIIVSILYKYHISRKMKAKRMFEKLGVSILYKYHISHLEYSSYRAWCRRCRSFISIIFPLLNIAHFGL